MILQGRGGHSPLATPCSVVCQPFCGTLHYMVPHEPYIDEDGSLLMEVNHFAQEGERKYPDTFFDLLHRDSGRENYVTKNEFKRVYESSVKYILKHISDILEQLDGLTVITSDHGELLGERMRPFPFIGFRHKQGIHMNELLKIPWFVYNKDSQRRKIIEEDEPHHSMGKTEDISEQVNEHLRHMGYKI